MDLYVYSSAAFSLRAGAFFGTGSAFFIEDVSPCLVEAEKIGGGRITFTAGPRMREIERADLFPLPCGAAVRLNFPRAISGGFGVIAQKRFGKVLVTVYRDGTTRITAETANAFNTAECPIGGEDFCVEKSGGYIAVFTKTRPQFLALFSAENAALLFSGIVENHELSPLFRTKKRLFDFERTTVTVGWRQCGDKLEGSVEKVERGRPYDMKFGDKVLARVLAERIKNGFSASDLLAPDLKESEAVIGEYLGDFDEVLPPFLCEKGVFLAKCENRSAHVRRFAVSSEGGLITNIEEL